MFGINRSFGRLRKTTFLCDPLRSHINHNDKNHPHEKPIDLIQKMIEHSSKKGDLVLDPFCGSGSTCKACGQMGRRWIGIELDEKWIENSTKFLGGKND